MEGTTPTSLAALRAATCSAFSALSERARQALMIKTARTGPGMRRLCRELGLPHDAFRNEKAARLHEPRMTKSLLKEKHEDELLRMLQFFFADVETDMNGRYLAEVASGMKPHEAVEVVASEFAT